MLMGKRQVYRHIRFKARYINLYRALFIMVPVKKTTDERRPAMLSYHGQKRAKKRFGISYDKAESRFEEAKLYGKYKEDYEFRSEEYDYLLSKERHKGNQTVAYNGVLYIFDGDTCITMFNQPAWFERKKHYEGKQQVRHVKAYMRHYEDWAEVQEVA